MPRTTRWRTLGGAAAACLALVACGDDSAQNGSKGPSGPRLYAEKGCVACHGSRGEGTFMGPKLEALGSHWEREALARFFVDPTATAKQNARLGELMRAYRTPMTPIAATEAERLAIADWLLATFP
jgi:mono/diheme cytochrome c family protein